MAGNINQAYSLVIQACNDPNIGYSQPDRYSITLGASYVTHCDCSSLISWVLFNSGFTPAGTWFTTSNINSDPSILTRLGFNQYPATAVEWEAGDIVFRYRFENGKWRKHMEMVYQANGIGGITMGAHEDGIPFAQQVSINSKPTNASQYDYIFKLGEVAEWDGELPIPVPDEDTGAPPRSLYNAFIDWELRRRLVKPF